MTANTPPEVAPTLKDIVGKRHANSVNECIDKFNHKHVQQGEEARIAGALFLEEDGKLAAAALPAAVVAVGSILATDVSDSGVPLLVVAAVLAIAWLVIRLHINTSQRKLAVAKKVMDYRRESKDSLPSPAPAPQEITVTVTGVDPDFQAVTVARWRGWTLTTRRRR